MPGMRIIYPLTKLPIDQISVMYVIDLGSGNAVNSIFYDFEIEIQFHFQNGEVLKSMFRSIQTAALAVCAFCLLLPIRSQGQENYFVTYSHQMEEPGNLELATRTVNGFPSASRGFLGSALELE